jgi:hypothetical protein
MSQLQGSRIEMHEDSWKLTDPRVHLLAWMYPKMSSLIGIYSSYLHLVLQIHLGEATE